MQGCETKDTKVVNLSLQVIQRLITAQVRSLLYIFLFNSRNIILYNMKGKNIFETGMSKLLLKEFKKILSGLPFRLKFFIYYFLK